jgi:hypothetical protein
MMRRWPSWSRSLYWRIAVTFVVFMIGVLVAQSLVFSYMTARSSPTFLSPNVLAVTAEGAESRRLRAQGIFRTGHTSHSHSAPTVLPGLLP